MTAAPTSHAPNIALTPIRGALREGEVNALDVLVRIQGPQAPAAGMSSPHVPRALALVIDSSGSMRGRPLDEAKRCAERVVERLHPSDKVAVVQFDQKARLRWPAVEISDRRAILDAIRFIQSGGSTALHDGWLHGVNALFGSNTPGLRRVILLSDGEANIGERDPHVISSDCAKWAAKGITTSTYGLGESFNEDLMVAMAQKGGGSQYFGQTADDLMETFEQELSLIDLRYLTEVRATFQGLPGVQIEVLNDLITDGDVYKLPDVAYASEAWALLRLTVPVTALDTANKGSPLLRISVTGRGVDGEVITLAPVSLSMPVVTRDTWLQIPEDELVQRRLTEVSAAQALDKMREAMRRGDLAAVQAMLSEARATFEGNEWIHAILTSMERMAQDRESVKFMTKEMLYSSTYLRSKVRARDEVAQSLQSDGSLPAFLRRRGTQGKDPS